MHLPSIESLARDWRLTWSAMGPGGLLLLADYDEDAAARIAGELAGVPWPPAASRGEWQRAVETLNQAIAAELRAFFRDARLDPGTYAIPNYYGPQARGGRVPQDSISDGRNAIAVPDSSEIAFAFSREHLALVRAANVSTWEFLAAPLDPHAPYGASASHYLDMARALGERFDGAFAARYDRLHGEMLFAAHAFLLHARI
jgi:hypothetical protein